MKSFWKGFELGLYRGTVASLILVVIAAFVLSLSLVTRGHAATVKPLCSWDHPGANRYTGEVPAAVDSYTDIPAGVRANLKRRMDRRLYDDVVVIRRDSINGFETRYTDLRDMHFGSGSRCIKVSRAKWTDKHEERGLIYCEREHCIIVPTVCGNVARVTLIPEAVLPPVKVVATPEIPPGGDFTFPVYLEPELPSIPHTRPNWVFWPSHPGIGEPPRYTTVLPPIYPVYPPVVRPPTVEPPVGEPPITKPPVTEPPVTYPPVTPPPASPVPEPALGSMLILGLAAVVIAIRRKRLNSQPKGETQ